MHKFNRSLSAPLEDSLLDFEMLPHKSAVLKMTSFHAAHGNRAGPAIRAWPAGRPRPTRD